jgi:hypothetical protein
MHTWTDVGRGKLVRAQNVNITDQYKPLFGIKEKMNGMGPFCDGNDCMPAPSGTYIIHMPPCMMLRGSRSDEEQAAYLEVCGGLEGGEF